MESVQVGERGPGSITCMFVGGLVGVFSSSLHGHRGPGEGLSRGEPVQLLSVVWFLDDPRVRCAFLQVLSLRVPRGFYFTQSPQCSSRLWRLVSSTKQFLSFERGKESFPVEARCGRGLQRKKTPNRTSLHPAAVVSSKCPEDSSPALFCRLDDVAGAGVRSKVNFRTFSAGTGSQGESR